MYYYLIPQQNVDAIKVIEFLNNTQCEFKYRQYTKSKNKTYLWSIFFEDNYKEQNISIYMSFFYKDDGKSLDGIRVLVHNPTIVKDEVLQEHLEILLTEILSLSKKWEVIDLFSNEVVEIPILDSIQQYSSMFRSTLETIYAEDQRERSLYIRIMRLDVPKISRDEQTIDNLIEEISKINDEAIQKLFIYHLATHIKDCTLSTKQFTALHKLLNKFDCINNDLVFVSKLNLYIHEYAIYRKETVNTGKLFVKQFRNRKNLSDYMYALLVEYFHQRKQYEQFFEVALEDYDTYGSEYSRQYLKENLNKLKGRSRFELFLKLNKSSKDKLFLNHLFSKFLLLLVTLIPLAVSYLLFVLPPMLNPNTLNFIIKTDILISILFLALTNILILSIILSTIALIISAKSNNPTKANNILNVFTIVSCLLIMLCSLFPSMYLVSTTYTYISKEEIAGDANKFSYDSIDTIHLTLISPEEKCPEAEKSSSYPCLYRLEIHVTEKASEKILLNREYLSVEEADQFILSDEKSTKYLLEQIEIYNIKVETNFDEIQLDNAKIPKSYKKILKQFI